MSLDEEGLDPIALHSLYRWLDTIPLPSLPKKSGILARDFSDGTCVADIIHYYNPKIIEVHNYVRTCNSEQKLANWETLERKVLKKHLGLSLGGRQCIEEVCVSGGGRNRALEEFLYRLMILFEGMNDPESREDDSTIPDRTAPYTRESVLLERNDNVMRGDHDGTTMEQLKDMITLLEETCRKQDSIIRLQQAKIEALSERLQE